MSDSLLDKILKAKQKYNINGIHDNDMKDNPLFSDEFNYLFSDEKNFDIDSIFHSYSDDKEVNSIFYDDDTDIIISSNMIRKDYSFCCLCGVDKYKHDNGHKFFKAFDEHRCKKCNKFYFEHRGNNTCNWVPYKFLH